MGTQHPDNVNTPFFASNHVMNGEDEVQEAYYSFSHLKINEQLWDIEGKEVDNHVISKLLSKYPHYFKDNVLGEDKFLTIRAPNPDIQKTEAKILAEVIYSIPRNHDIASTFYGRDVAPIFEVVIPMCESEKPILRLRDFYNQFVNKAHESTVNDVKLSSWLGHFKPEKIRVTPLFETKDQILNAHTSIKKYLEQTKEEMSRVWYARSDPALNYGSLSAILMVKIALQRLKRIEEETSKELFPIIGMGSAPFRGNFKPQTAPQILKGYPSVQTFTLQSAYKYDHPISEVIDSIEYIDSISRKDPLQIDEEMALKYIDIIEKEYSEMVSELAPTINHISKYLPERRMRKTHTGLFGYSRATKGLQLPRAIKFCGALYSIGLPPEILGLSALTSHDLENIKTFYSNIDYDMKEALQYLNRENLGILPESVRKKVLNALKLFEYEENIEHYEATTKIVEAMKHNDQQGMNDWVLKAAEVRKFLG
ncbi:MAG: phosphoenolpyruvate carboxylase [Candidatus Woesearchaeota archaeon]